MRLRVYQDFHDLDYMAEAWNALVTQSASHVPFLRFEYLKTWWTYKGGGEWQNGDLYVVTAHSDSDELVGIAPLFFSQNLDKKNALMFLGSFEISDYLDMIVRPKDSTAFINALLKYLSGPDAPAWDVLDFYNLLDDSATLVELKNNAAVIGLHYSEETIQPSPYLPLPNDWEAYLAGINKKQRHEIRRKIRRAESAEGGTNWYIVEDEATLDDEIDAFLKLMSHDQHKKEFLTDVMRSQMRASVHSAFKAGWLQLAFMEIGGEKAAAYLNFDFDNRIWLYNSGINFDFNYYSPGWVLLANLIQWCIDNGRETLDFMRGDEDYKYRFGGINRYVLRAQLERS
jgi:CelD/BcsL family acetyltransferase involved in cellulose biosynthesis